MVQRIYKSWLFIGYPGILLLPKLDNAVIVLDLEEFTQGIDKVTACQQFKKLQEKFKSQKLAIRLDVFNGDGEIQFNTLQVAPDYIFLPQVEKIADIEPLVKSIQMRGWFNTAIVPTIETIKGLNQLDQILKRELMISHVLLGTGDLSADIGIAESSTRMQQMQPLREQFFNICQHYHAQAIDGPWPLSISEHDKSSDDAFSRQVGFINRCVLSINQIHSWQQEIEG